MNNIDYCDCCKHLTDVESCSGCGLEFCEYCKETHDCEPDDSWFHDTDMEAR